MSHASQKQHKLITSIINLFIDHVYESTCVAIKYMFILS